MRKGPFSLIFGLISFLAVTVGYGQKAVIKVTDRKSKEPVPYAHVCFEGLISGSPKYSLTSMDGTVVNDIKEKSKIAVSYMGYVTKIDTINPGENLTIDLQPLVLNMDEVVVTGQYRPERADKSIYKIEVINSRQIEQKAANNMADLLKDQTNMSITQDGVLGTSLKMMGMSGANVKFLQDGVPLIGRMNGNFDLNQLNLNNVDHVEIIEGPMSVIYGSNALAGVINIITKENRNSFLNTTANTYTESVGVFNFDGSVSLNKKKHGISLDGGRNFFDGFEAPGDAPRDLTFKPRRQYFFDGYYIFSATNLKLKFTGDYFNELLLDKGPLLGPYYETAFDNHFTTIRFSGRADGTVTLPNKHFISLLASWSAYDRIRETYFKDLTTLTEYPVRQSWAQDTTKIRSIVARGTFAKSNADKKFNYQTGFDINNETGTGKKIDDNKQEIGDYAAFFSVTYNPVTAFSLQPGIRFIYNTKYDAPVVYALSAKWAILEGLSFRGSYSRGFRTPDIKELYLVFVDVNHNVHGNADLQAEKSNNFNLNLNFAREEKKVAWSYDLSAFYNFIQNKIELAQTGADAEYRYENVSRYKTAGLNGNISYSLYPSLKMQIGFSETGVTGSPEEDVDYQKFKWSTEVTFSPSYRFIKQDITLALYYKYTGAAPQLVFNEKQIVWQWVEAYNMMDFTASKGFWNNRVRLSTGVKNIFNTIVVPTTGGQGGAHSGGSGNNIAWGRTIFLKLTFQFNQYK